MKKPPTKRPHAEDIPHGLTHALFLLVWRLSPAARAAVLPPVVLLIVSFATWHALSESVKNEAFEWLTRQLPIVFFEAGKTARSSQVIEVTRLCEIDARLAREAQAAGEPTQHREISDYYRQANRKLFEHLDSVAQTYESNERHVGLTYIMGAPGVGKSFVLRQLKKTATTLELKKFFDAHRAELGVEQQPDLAPLDRERSKRLPFNSLPGIPRDAVLTVDRLLTLAEAGASSPAGGRANARRVIIFDDLDEVHRDASFKVLGAIDQYLATRPADESFLHVIVAGRPEAFAEYLIDPHWVAPLEFKKFQLRPPAYVTDEALELFAHNFYQYRNRDPVPSADDFIHLVRNHGFLTYSIGTLNVGNLVVEQALLNKEKQTAEELQRKLYSGLLDRAYDSHKRPVNAPEYELLLEEIAARYSGGVKDDGRFLVNPDDVVPVLDARGTPIDGVKVRVRDVLDRSGLAWLDPADLRTERGYRFHPFWLHTYLAERWNARVHPGYKYRGCSAAGGRTRESA